jgi:hypothetical protein
LCVIICVSPEPYVLCAVCWVLGAGCWVLGAGCWVLGLGAVSCVLYAVRPQCHVMSYLNPCPKKLCHIWKRQKHRMPLVITNLIRNGAETRHPIYVGLMYTAGFWRGGGRERGQGKGSAPCHPAVPIAPCEFFLPIWEDDASKVLAETYENRFSGIDA